MTTITKERAELKAFIAGFLSDPAHDNQSSRSMTAEVFRIALASLDAKPIYQYQSGIYNDDNGETDWYWDDCDAGFYKQYAADRRRIVYTAAPAPVVPEECPAELPYAQVKAVADLFALCWQSGEVVTYTPDPEKATIWLNNYSGTCVQEYVKLERLQEALSGNSPVVPDDISGIIERFQYQADHLSEWHHIDEHSCKVNRRDLMTALEFMDSCRAAMLQGVEPVSNHDELALYYLQGQKDGFEWAAQLAEANHPLTGDWLYDDPLELAKAIRKGPDMPEFAGSSPVTQDGWISCSERIPVIGELNWRTSFPLLVTCEIGVIPAYYGFVRVNGNKHYGFMESLKYGNDSGNHPQTNEYDLISNVTHWMPLPEPPQEVNRG